MKLAEGLVAHSMMDEHVLVSAGADKDKFQGIARVNGTGAFILECLKEETTRDEIIEKMTARYGGTRELAAKYADGFLEKLRGIGALDD